MITVVGSMTASLKSEFQIIPANPVSITTKSLLEKNLVIPATTETGGKNERDPEGKKEVPSKQGMADFQTVYERQVRENRRHNTKEAL